MAWRICFSRLAQWGMVWRRGKQRLSRAFQWGPFQWWPFRRGRSSVVCSRKVAVKDVLGGLRSSHPSSCVCHIQSVALSSLTPSSCPQNCLIMFCQEIVALAGFVGCRKEHHVVSSLSGQ